jgi:outer membrane protein OmpA-like peptidoglycan-associated protein
MSSHNSIVFLLSLALVTGLPALLLTSSASGTTGTIEAVLGDYGSPGVPVDGVAGTSSTFIIASGVGVDPEGNYLLGTQGGRLELLANSSTNPGYPLPADCGSGSTQCTWIVGDIYSLLGEGGSSLNGTPAAMFPANFVGTVSFDQEGNVIVPMGNGFNSVMVVAMSATNPGYVMRSTCGSMYNSLCTWTQGDVYYIVGQDGQFGFTDGASSATSELEDPVSTAVDSHGNVLVLDSEGAIVVDAISSTNPGYQLASDCGSGSSQCTWTAGDVFRIAGTYTSGATTDGASALNWQFDSPLGMTLDSSGNIVVGDTGNNTVDVVALSSSNPGYLLSGSDCAVSCTWASGHVYDAQYVASTGGTTTTYGGVALSHVMSSPGGVNFDSQGNLLIPNYGSDVLDMLALSNCSSSCSYGLSTYTQGHMYSIAGVGYAAGTAPYGDGGPASSANLGGPGPSSSFTGIDFGPVSDYVAFDSTTGDVVLADTPLSAVRAFTSGIAPTTTTTSTTTTTIYRAPATTTTTVPTTPTTTTTAPQTTTTTMAPRPPIHASVYFTLGQSVLSLADRAQLGAVVSSVVRERIDGLSVVGYSDPLSSGLAATQLGVSRAAVVTKYLEQALASRGDTSVHIGYRSGGVLHYSPYSRDRVAIVTS